jgi:glyoxylase I family protein
MATLAFHHVAISCRDLARTEAFYTKHFGFSRARAIPLGGGNEIVFLKNGSAYLELFQAEGDRPAPAVGGDGPHFPGFRHIAFKVESVDATLAAMGGDVTVTLGPLDFDAFIPGWRTVWVADPDGNIIEISQNFTDEAQG